MRLFNLFIFLILASMSVLAADIIDNVSPIWGVLGPLLLSFVERFPIIATIIFFLGTARFFMKPIMSAIITYTESTPTQSDDEFINKIRETNIYKVIIYLLDWALSVKMKK